nr:hypothetical protein [Tanacetum cinerariifolium]
ALRHLNPAAPNFVAELRKLDMIVVDSLLNNKLRKVTVPPSTPPVVPPGGGETGGQPKGGGNGPSGGGGHPPKQLPPRVVKQHHSDALDEVVLKLSATPDLAEKWQGEATKLWESLGSQLNDATYRLEADFTE